MPYTFKCPKLHILLSEKILKTFKFFNKDIFQLKCALHSQKNFSTFKSLMYMLLESKHLQNFQKNIDAQNLQVKCFEVQRPWNLSNMLHNTQAFQVMCC